VTSDVLTVELPRECVTDCTAPGQDASESVTYWLRRLGAEVLNRDGVIAVLRESGAWEAEELENADEQTLAMRVLWMRAGDEENGSASE
jgi:hypothetical protein